MLVTILFLIFVSNQNTMSNTKEVEIIIPNENILKRVNTTPTLKRLSKLSLRVGSNVETVNHYQFSEMKRMYSILDIKIIEL